MKLRFYDRLLTVLLAVFFLMLAAAIVAESAFNASVTPVLVKLFRQTGIAWVITRVAVIILCLVAAWRCLDITFRHSKRTDIEFVQQKTEGGELRVAVKAVEGLVRKCVANHDEIKLGSVHLENRKAGLTVIIGCQTAADISIPLAVNALQRQLREYIMESTGVEIHDIQVEVDDAQAELAGGTYRLHEAVIDPEAHSKTAGNAVPDTVKAPEAETEVPDEGAGQQDDMNGEQIPPVEETASEAAEEQTADPDQDKVTGEAGAEAPTAVPDEETAGAEAAGQDDKSAEEAAPQTAPVTDPLAPQETEDIPPVQEQPEKPLLHEIPEGEDIEPKKNWLGNLFSRK